MTDHAKEAVRLLGSVCPVDWQHHNLDLDQQIAFRAADIAEVQVHATLALVAEQRTANLLALIKASTSVVTLSDEQDLAITALHPAAGIIARAGGAE